ncbi:MAG: hypothetical protein HKP27_07970 [Myxococcales bacterium]|nr:hypothetical protein [Myxococcales bacterium]
MSDQTGPLLLLVQANVAAEHEAAFNRWYHNHVPTLMEIPGYRWGSRYSGVVGDEKYLAMYEIHDASYLESMLGPSEERRHPLASAEFAAFEKLEGVSDTRINVYQQVSGAHLGRPFPRADLPLSVVMVDCVDASREAEFDAWYSASHVPTLLRIPGYVSAARFKLYPHPALDWLGMGPKYLALYELADLECIPTLADPDQMRPEAAAEFARWTSYAAPMVDKMSWNIYRPMARHWPV